MTTAAIVILSAIVGGMTGAFVITCYIYFNNKGAK